MKTITKEVYLIAALLKDSTEPHVFISECEFLATPDYVVIGSQEVSFPAPAPESVSKALVGGLEEKVVTMRAAAEAAITEVHGQIQSLLALEHVEEWKDEEGNDVDKYGNPIDGDRIIYCCFPDCGCDGARCCEAENGASYGALELNIEKRT